MEIRTCEEYVRSLAYGVKGDTMKDVKAEQARIRIDAARRHLTDALEAVSRPEPDWARCEACMDMASDVLPTIIEGEPR